jgi:hypothetical protein
MIQEICRFRADAIGLATWRPVSWRYNPGARFQRVDAKARSSQRTVDYRPYQKGNDDADKALG